MSPELEIALEAATAAAEVSLKYYRGTFSVRAKPDRSPVTQADVECEQAIRSLILQRFPDHGFLGEETGRSRSSSGYLWLVDPIDGTKAFVRRYPFFSTQIALMREGTLVLGVSSGALFDEVAWAEKGEGAWLNGERLRVSDATDLRQAAVSTGNLKSLAAGDGWQRFGELVTIVDRIRGYGDFYQYHLLAAGKVDVVIESDVNILDIAALAVIVQEAGGVFTDLNGAPVGLGTRSVLAANKRLHGDILPRLEGYVR
jgi:histidinol-phosphatase